MVAPTETKDPVAFLSRVEPPPGTKGSLLSRVEPAPGTKSDRRLPPCRYFLSRWLLLSFLSLSSLSLPYLLPPAPFLSCLLSSLPPALSSLPGAGGPGEPQLGRGQAPAAGTSDGELRPLARGEQRPAAAARGRGGAAPAGPWRRRAAGR